jgi:hypothetical protein
MGDVYTRMPLNSLSSKSENRFLVNFQIMKATIPMTAIPPATDIPMIDPVLRLLLLLGGALAGELGETAEELEVVSVTVGGRPLGPVESGTAVFGAEVWVWGEEVCREVVEAKDWVVELDEDEDGEEEEEEDWEEDWEEVESAVWVEAGAEDWEEVVEGPPSNWALPPPARSSATSHDARTFIAALVVKDSPQVQLWLCYARLARPPRLAHPPPPTHRRRPPRPPALGPAAQGCHPHTPSSRRSPLYSTRLRCSGRHRISLQYHL